jgi:four helix bundle protein
MNREVMQQRTKIFAVEIIRFVQTIKPDTATGTITNQIVRSATSVGANYRAACRAKSDKDFVYKMTIVQEETDETLYWLELLQELSYGEAETRQKLIIEADQLVRMVSAAIMTMKKRNEQV